MKKMKAAPGATKPFSVDGADGRNGHKVLRTKTSPAREVEAAIQRYVDLFDFAPIGYVTFDRVGRIEEINFAALRLIGRTRKRLIGKTFAVFVAKEDSQAFLHHLLECRSSEGPVVTELQLQRASGERVPVQLSSTATFPLMKDGVRLYQTAIVDLTERKRYEEELRRSEERYHRLFDLVPVAVYTCDAKGVILEYNQQAADLWGRRPKPKDSAERFCGSLKIFHPDGRPMAHKNCPMARALRGEQLDKDDLEIVVERENGERRSVIPSPMILRNRRGKITGAINCLYDITEQRRTGLDAARLAAVVQSSHDAIVGKDLNGIITDWNKGAQRIFGYAPNEVIGKSILILIPSERQDEEQLILSKIRRGQFIDHYETVRRRKDGKLIDVSLTISPIRNRRGKIIGVSKIARDITAQKKAAEALRHSEEMHRALVSQTGVGMAQCNLKGELEFVNQTLCEMLGYKESELIGRANFHITHPDDVAATRKAFQRLVREGKPYQIEKRYLRKNGSILWVSVSATPMRDANSKTQAAVAVIVDISERKRALQALEDSKELLEKRVVERTAELIAANEELHNEIALRKRLEGEIIGISDREQRRLGQDLHDSLCQNLTAIAFMARAMARRLTDHRVIEVEDLEKIADLINEGVTEARTVARGLHPVEMDSAGLSSALRALMHRQSKIPYRLDLDDKIQITDPTVALHLFRIAREAVLNANKHARARELILKMRRSPKYIELSVTDDGMGPPTKFVEGPGMGFHIMEYRARSIGARLEITPVKPRGTCVACYLPLK